MYAHLDRAVDGVAALLGMSGITRRITSPLAAVDFRAGEAGVLGSRTGVSGPAEGLFSTFAGAPVSGLEGGALFPRECMSANTITIAITTPASASMGLRFGKALGSRIVLAAGAATALISASDAGAGECPPGWSRA